jgi:phosphoribosylformimino-5-aminoimidazole carboxamide ribotide isomerase
MIVFPAIDLLEGRAVRLRQGDPSRVAFVGDDPVAVARRWVDEGAAWLHVVDLDGALSGSPRHLALVERICRAVPVPVQAGGGLRTVADLRAAYEAGAARAVLGTAALDAGVLREALERYGDRIAAALDARDGAVAVRGWSETASLTVVEAARTLAAAGAARFVYTSVARDGMLTGPDLDGLAALRAAVAVPVVLAGGVGSAADVLAAARAGADGVIIGRALYDGRLSLADALRAAGGVHAR